MDKTIYVNTSAATITAALVNADSMPSKLPDLVIGDTYKFKALFVGEAPDFGSGDTYLFNLGFIAKPTAGTYRLSYGDDTTADIPHDADAETVQTALNELKSITAAGGVDVMGAAGSPFKIEFRVAGTRTAIEVKTKLYPESRAYISTIRAGDETHTAVQAIAIKLDTIAAVSNYSPDAENSGLSFDVSINTIEAILALSGGQSVDVVGEMKAVKSDGSVRTFFQANCKIINQLIDTGELSAATPAMESVVKIVNKAVAACAAAAETATTKAAEASAFATAADTSADLAGEHATTATDKASEAATSAETAQTAKTDAETANTNAQTAKTAAESAATRAQAAALSMSVCERVGTFHFGSAGGALQTTGNPMYGVLDQSHCMTLELDEDFQFSTHSAMSLNFTGDNQYNSGYYGIGLTLGRNGRFLLRAGNGSRDGGYFGNAPFLNNVFGGTDPNTIPAGKYAFCLCMHFDATDPTASTARIYVNGAKKWDFGYPTTLDENSATVPLQTSTIAWLENSKLGFFDTANYHKTDSTNFGYGHFEGKANRFAVFNFDMSASDAPYTPGDYASGKRIPVALQSSTAEKRCIVASADYSFGGKVRDISGNENHLTVCGDVKGDKDEAVRQMYNAFSAAYTAENATA